MALLRRGVPVVGLARLHQSLPLVLKVRSSLTKGCLLSREDEKAWKNPLEQVVVPEARQDLVALGLAQESLEQARPWSAVQIQALHRASCYHVSASSDSPAAS
jgi:hypothetical protein